MRGVLGHIFSPEAIVGLLVLSLALLLTGFRRKAGAVFLLAIMLAFLPGFRAFLLQFFPFWVTIIISVLIVLVALRFVLGLLLGDAANQTVGQLAAEMIKGIFKLPFWLGRQLKLGSLLRSTGLAVGRAGLGVARQSGAYANDLLAARKATGHSHLRTGQASSGKIAAIEGQDYYVDLGGGVTGILPLESCEEQLEVGQEVACKIVEPVDDYIVEVRLYRARQ